MEWLLRFAMVVKIVVNFFGAPQPFKEMTFTALLTLGRREVTDKKRLLHYFKYN